MTLALSDQANVDFVLALRRKWASDLYPKLRLEYEREFGDPSAGKPDDIADKVHGLPLYPWFAWLERGSQKMLWRATQDAILNAHDAPGPEISGRSRVELDPNLVFPDWYTDWDIHLQPGGVWATQNSAQVYELGAKLVMLGKNDDYGFHHLFVDTGLPKRAYRRIVDLGCGFGKSTWPLKAKFPDADVIGIDFSAPCLELAAAKANQRQLDIIFRQADAAATGLADGSVDLVTSTMLIHEVPIDHLARIFEEAMRVLSNGGQISFLDFQFTGDAFRDLAMIEHGARNNEPFMPPMMRADLPALAERAGLKNISWTAFDERAAGKLSQKAWPQRTEWHFPWAIFSAEKPE